MEFSLASGREVLSRTPSSLSSLLRDLPDDWILGDEGPNTWSPYQVVGHLVHIEEVDWIDRTRVILEGSQEAAFRPIDREAGFARFKGRSLSDLLDRFSMTRSANLVELDSLVTPHDLARTGRHPDFGEVSLSQLLATWVVHDLNHLGQIVKAMAKQYGDAVGPWREYLPIIDAP
jgi:uncharacterized damage-inducible protein DinB